MNFSCLSLFFRLPLVVLVFGLIFVFDGNFPKADNLAISVEIADYFDERDDKKSFDDGLPIVTFKLTLNQHFNRVSLDLGFVPKIVPLELHATGPPYV